MHNGGVIKIISNIYTSPSLEVREALIDVTFTVGEVHEPPENPR